MKKIFFLTILISFPLISFGQQAQTYTVELARMFSKDIFELNGVPFLEPVVKVVNGTSNTRYFNSAFVPKKVDKPYFKIGIQGMLGFVGEDMKSFVPSLPTKQYNDADMLGFIKFKENNILKGIERLDTAGLIHYIFLNLTYDGLKKGSIILPKSAQTALGSDAHTAFILPRDTMKSLLKTHPLYSNPLIPQSLKDSLNGYMNLLPEYYPIYGGTNMNSIAAAAPQIEIGSFLGTELLIRFIPPVNLGKTVGDFAFWGFGLKHSISQYFNDTTLNLAVQAVYQGTNLKNTVGTTNAELEANATMYNFNIHASKSIEDWFDIYSGLSYEMISIESTYLYQLSTELQWQLGLLEKPNYVPTPGYTGDTAPQKTTLKVSDDNIKFTVGMAKSVGDFRFYFDYNISSFNIFSGGIQYIF